MQLPGVESLGGGSSGTWGSHYHGFDRTSSIWHNETRLGSVIQFDNDCIMGNLENDYTENTKGIMLIQFSARSVKKIGLDEHRLSPQEESQYGKTEGKELRSKMACYPCKSKNAVFSMAQYQESKP